MQHAQAEYPGTSRGAWVTATIVVVISVLSTFTLSNPDDTSTVASGGSIGPQEYSVDEGVTDNAAVATGGPTQRRIAGTKGGDGGVDGTAGEGAGGPGSESAAGSASAAGNADCEKQENAGATDTGVTPRSIEFAATVVKSGIAKSFLSDAQFGMEAVRQKVNAGGGVCGRLINIKYDDDGWDPSRGEQFIQKYIGSKGYFGLAVNPSSEGLRFPIDNGTLAANQFPVVGADGMLIGQYQSDWVWPVATSTHSVMHILARDAIARGATSFGIVWDSDYRFGVEGERAFRGVASRAGIPVVSQPLKAGASGQGTYRNEVNKFIGDCSGEKQFDECEFVALLLEPTTAEQWVRDGGMGNGEERPKYGFGAPQPLFVTSFVRNCGSLCANLRVWTSFKPPIAPFDTDPAVATYRSDLANVSTSADASNPHVEGAYVGMLLLVDALERLGAAPTRAGLKEILDGTTLETGLTKPLKFAPGNHFSATSALAFEAVYQGDSFNGWRYTQSDFVEDTEVSQDLK